MDEIIDRWFRNWRYFWALLNHNNAAEQIIIMRSFRRTFNNDKLYLNYPTTVIYIHLSSYHVFTLGRQCSFPFSINLCAVGLNCKTTTYIYTAWNVYIDSDKFSLYVQCSPSCPGWIDMVFTWSVCMPYWLVHAEANLLALCAHSYRKTFCLQTE